MAQQALSQEEVDALLAGVNGEDEDADDEEPDVQVLAATVVHHFQEYRERLDIGGTPTPDDPSVLSYLVAAAVVLPTAERQRLLEAPDTRARLTAELELLKRETALVDAFGTVPATELPAHPANPN